jgi:cation diffusion facilitator CzcD-associated flavoprotein CzcO
MTPLFSPYHVVQPYHEAYAEQFDLFPYIRLNHSVASALWVGNAMQGYWDLTLQSGYPVETIPGISSTHTTKYQNEDTTEHFDHLVVANGHNHYPRIPEWSKNSDWVGGKEGRRVFHSVFFRELDVYAGKTVLIVGGGSSGMDIAAQVSKYADKACVFALRIHPCSSVHRHITHSVTTP